MLVARKRLLRLAMVVVDVVTLTAGLLIAYEVVGVGFHRNFVSFTSYGWLLGPIFLVWLACLSTFGLYRSAAYFSMRRVLTCLLQGQLLAGALLFSVMYLTHSEVISRLLLQTFLAVSFILLAFQKLTVVVYFDKVRQRADLQPRKVVLVSDLAIAERYLRLMRNRVSLLADVIRVLAPTAVNDQRLGFAAVDAPLGTIDDLPALLHKQVVDEVIAVPPLDRSLLEQLSRCCSVRGIVLRIWLELPCPVIGHWAAEYFGENLFVVSLAAVPQKALHLGLKRMIDVLGAVVGMIFCAIVYVCYGRRLRRESRGSPLFCQQRIGKNGRAFRLYKFRTMCLEAEQQKAAVSVHNEMRGPMFKIRDDPRVTFTGRKLRRHHLDELPQFWNVLKGDMSLVGTRPPTGDETSAYHEHHHRRLSIKPGITGLWQLNGNGAIKDFEDVFNLDCEYIDNWSLWLDFKILSRTIGKVLRGDGW
jgi:exopolysaccharide biosynthesis polyprenyl glycosylphosphotransferase